MPNEFTLDCVLRACGRLGSLIGGRIVHRLLIKYGFEFDHSIGGALIELYCDCKAVEDAKMVYDRMGNPCLNASNSLIGGLILMGRIKDAELIFNGLLEMNPISCNLMTKGYGMSGQVKESKMIFSRMTQKTIISLNTMISMYFRKGELDKALGLFEETKGERNSVTWNLMMSGYIQNHHHEEAFKLGAFTYRRIGASLAHPLTSIIILY